MTRIRHILLVTIKILLLVLIITVLTDCRKEPTYRIGVSQCSEDDWRQLMNEEIEREIMFHPEATVEIRSADDSNDKQISDIRYFIESGFDIIIAAPNEADALTPIISEAYDKGIPVLLFDRNVNGDKYTAFQGADNAAIGSAAARYAHMLLPSGGNVIELEGLPGSTPTIERARGFHNVTDSVGNMEIVASVAANWNYDDARRVADSLLSLHPDAALVYAHNDRMAIGAADAARSRGLHPYIIGIDAAPTIGMKAVDEGKIDATFLYPTEGEELVRTALAILNGEDYEKKLLTPATPAINRDNVKLLLHQVKELNDETAQLKQLKGELDTYWSQHNSQTAFLYAIVAALILMCIVLFLVVRAFWDHRRRQAELMEKNRQLMEKMMERKYPAADPGSELEGEPKDRENEFASKLMSTVDREMGNSDLSVDDMAEKMGMGRSKFYRKCKSVTGLSPVEFLRDMRLKSARHMLVSTDKTVSEIGYEVGFSTPAYFTKCYREVYGETPTALRERAKGG